MTFEIAHIEKNDRSQVKQIVAEHWGDETIVVHNDIFHAGELDGFKAVEENRIIGILHYRMIGSTCEILTLASLQENQGIGSALIKSIEKIAREKGCQKLCLTTTNDNLHALGFYQRRGFHLAALYPNQLKISRKIKPTIPEIGLEDIPLRDELRLEKELA